MRQMRLQGLLPQPEEKNEVVHATCDLLDRPSCQDVSSRIQPLSFHVRQGGHGSTYTRYFSRTED